MTSGYVFLTIIGSCELEYEWIMRNKKKTLKMKDSTVIALNRVSVVPSLLCGTLATPDDITA